MAYSELIKSFERIRNYMREFFVFGFKSREEYSSKSVRSYDNERRRIESWMGDYMSFRRTEGGKNVFISVDSREIDKNPLFKAFRARSFTDKDITLYFYVMDILREGDRLSAADIQDLIAENYLHPLGSELEFDLSTLRKKLREFEELGLIRAEKMGNRLLYRLADTGEADEIIDRCCLEALAFFMEEAPLGVIGNGILERPAGNMNESLRISHKHHYILDVLDSEIILELLYAIQDHRTVEVQAVSRLGRDLYRSLVPMKIFASTQQGRYYLIGYSERIENFDAVRIDNIHSVKAGGRYEGYEELAERFEEFRKHLWGVAIDRHNRVRHIEMDVEVGEGEDFIVERLRREARCGEVLKISDGVWRYRADVYDTLEMLPWIRTLTGRIVRLKSSDGFVEERFYEDLGRMNRLYKDPEGGGDAVS